MTLRVLLGTLAVAMVGLPVEADAAMRGLETEEAKLEWPLRRDERDHFNDVTRVCLVYGRFAVLTTTVGILGGVDLEFRTRPAGMPPKEVCADSFRGRSVRSNRPDGASAGYPIGVIGHHVACLHHESFGSLGRFIIFDMTTGAAVYDDNYYLHVEVGGVSFEPGSGGPTLTYWRGIGKTDCLPRRGEKECWTSIRKRHGIPSSVPQPDCEDWISPDGTPDSADYQIKVHVRVPRLTRRKAMFLGDRPACSPAR